MRTFIYIVCAVIILIVIYGIYIYVNSGLSANQLNTPFQNVIGAAGQPTPKPPVDINNNGRPIDSDTKVIHAGDKLKALEVIPIYKEPTVVSSANRVITGWFIPTPAYIPTNNFIGFFVSRVDDNWIKIAKFPDWDNLPAVYYIYKSAKFTVEPYVL